MLPKQAAFDCDLVKHYLREKYNLRTLKTEASLPLDWFQDEAEQKGISLTDMDALFAALPYGARDFLMNYGRVLKEYAERVKQEGPPSSDYLFTLLGSLSNRLHDGITVLRKARQLHSLSSERSAAITALEVHFDGELARYKIELERIRSLP